MLSYKFSGKKSGLVFSAWEPRLAWSYLFNSYDRLCFTKIVSPSPQVGCFTSQKHTHTQTPRTKDLWQVLSFSWANGRKFWSSHIKKKTAGVNSTANRDPPEIPGPRPTTQLTTDVIRKDLWKILAFGEIHQLSIGLFMTFFIKAPCWFVREKHIKIVERFSKFDPSSFKLSPPRWNSSPPRWSCFHHHFPDCPGSLNLFDVMHFPFSCFGRDSSFFWVEEDELFHKPLGKPHQFSRHLGL